MRTDYHHLRKGLVEKIDYSIALLRRAESLALKYNPNDGFYLAFSGGKDSQCLYHVAQLAGVKFKAHFSPTSVDPPQLIMFIKHNYPNVEFGKIKKSIYDVAVDMGILPTMTVRWCCQKFKEHSGEGQVTLIGIRHAESVRRSKRKEFEISHHKFSGSEEQFSEWQQEQIKKKMKNLNHDQFSIDKEHEVKCINGKDSILISPIINWTDEDVWDFLNGMDIVHCELYDRGYKRIGCILCPMSTYKNKLRDIRDFPHVKEKWIRAIMYIRCFGGVQKANKHYTTITREKDGLQAINPHNNRMWLGGGRKNKGLWSSPFLVGSPDKSAVLESEAEERKIAETIFDWWVSGKPYTQWYSEKFQQMKIDFDNENDTGQ